ncbi:hypothetical protein Bbelb_001210 [Branchiostoma belcheri]|nr:hypothetical protein Bbelb_001210 [Branchiostoma belcheri]
MAHENITCIPKDWPLTIICNGEVYDEEEPPLTIYDAHFWIYLGVYVALVMVAGLMAGLTMGLLSLDKNSLKVLKEGGKPSERKHAAKILPIVENHHLLLVTLLLTNAGAVEAMPIFLDKISNPIIAIVVSVTAVLIFGEVIPQAVCSRYGLAIGAFFSPMVRVLIFLTFIISWPLSKLLDCLLGEDHGTFFRRAELRALVDIHAEEARENEEPLNTDEVLIIQGALQMRDKTAGSALTPFDKVFMLSIDGKMDKETMDMVIEAGHSRVPVYDGEKTNIVGLLLVKMLIKLDPVAATPIRSILQENPRYLPAVREDTPLFYLLNEFQQGKCHMCAVRMVDSTGEAGDVLGVITLEDVIEELIQEEIMDESDVIADVNRRVNLARARASRQMSRQSPRRALPRRSLSGGSTGSDYGATLTINTDTSEHAGLIDNESPTAGH